jgi:hypothetical protein
MLKIPTAKVDELMWLNTAWQHWENDTFSANSVLSWSAFHAQKADKSHQKCCH